MNTVLKKSVLLAMLALLCSLNAVQAQMFLLEDVNGKPIRKGTYENINGSPYLRDEYSVGKVVLANGDMYENVLLRYDQVADQLMFKTKEGKELELVQPVQQFSLTEGDKPVFRSGFAPVDNNTSTSFYQVLVDGKVKLLKKSHKAIREEKAYGTATVNKNIIEYTNYFVAVDGNTHKVKNEKSLLEALPGKEAEVAAYVKQNKLKLKNEQDMVQLVKYYNIL